MARQPAVGLSPPIVAGQRQVDAGLGLVGQTHHGGRGPGLDDGAQRGGAGLEVGERPGLVPGAFGTGCTRSAHLGDDAESALGAERTTRAGRGRPPRRDARPRSRVPRRGGDAQPRRPCRRSGRTRRTPVPTTGSRRTRRSWRTGSSAGSGRGRTRARRGAAPPAGRSGRPAASRRADTGSIGRARSVAAGRGRLRSGTGRGRGRHRRRRWCRRRTGPPRHRSAAQHAQQCQHLVVASRAARPRQERPAGRWPCGAAGPGCSCRRRAAGGTRRRCGRGRRRGVRGGRR